MIIKPVFARVVIERETLEKKYKDIIIPESVSKDNTSHEYGTVIATGPECDESIQPGHRVMFGRYAGGWFKFNDHDIYVVNDEDIIAVIEDDDAGPAD